MRTVPPEPDDGEESIEVVRVPGVRHRWTLDVEHFRPGAEEPNLTFRFRASSMLEVEQQIAEHMSTRADSIRREVHRFDQRDFHLADDSRVEFWWELHTMDPRCLDCGVDTHAIDEYYMVVDDLWLAAQPRRRGSLCVGCLETRLGRQLVGGDFADLPVNADPIGRSARLEARMQTGSHLIRRYPATMTDCVFCKIVAGEIPAEKVAESDLAFAFRDLNPQAPVHVLVVPKRHEPDIGSLAAADADSAVAVLDLACAVAEQENGGSYRLVFNTGADAQQTVFHCHAHVLAGRAMTWPPG